MSTPVDGEGADGGRAGADGQGTDGAGGELRGRTVVHLTTTDMSLALLLGPQLRAFAAAGLEVVGVSAPGPFVDALAADGIRHVPLAHATRSVAVGHDLAALAEVGRVFRRLRPDIVHTHNPKPGLYGRVAARAVGVPAIVNTVHGLYATPDDPWPRRAGVYALERAAAACSDLELVQNPEDVAVLRRLRVPAARVTLLGNGIDLTRFSVAADPGARRRARASLGVDEGATVVGTVGRLVRGKGIPELFEVAGRLARQRPDVVVVVIGPEDPAKADALPPAALDHARALGNVVLAGHRDDVDALYAAMDVFVLASHREGFPRAAMEAAACGLPVVATDIRGCRQVVEDGVTGVLVPVGDAGRLGDAVVGLVDDPERRAALGRQARRRAEAEFDERRVIDRTLAGYRRVLAGARARTSRRIRSRASSPS